MQNIRNSFGLDSTGHLFTKGVVTVRAKWDVQNTNLEQNCAGGSIYDGKKLSILHKKLCLSSFNGARIV
ncbi:hypothetical protein HI914_07361 [Erysiphe necator]|nr:hypothetical protein HI914_07361 [Erysiphe necator]